MSTCNDLRVHTVDLLTWGDAGQRQSPDSSCGHRHTALGRQRTTFHFGQEPRSQCLLSDCWTPGYVAGCRSGALKEGLPVHLRTWATEWDLRAVVPEMPVCLLHAMPHPSPWSWLLTQLYAQPPSTHGSWLQLP